MIYGGREHTPAYRDKGRKIMTIKIGILGSTRGTSAQPIIDAIQNGELNASIAIVISDVENATILKRASKHHINHVYVPVSGQNRHDYHRVVSQYLQDAHVDVILCIGYMRIISDEFVHQWRGRILNIHPSLLPDFAGGMNNDVHQAVLDSGITTTGCTVHQVTEIVDGGDIVLQKSCTVLPTDTVQILKDRVQTLEGEALIEVLKNWEHTKHDNT